MKNTFLLLLTFLITGTIFSQTSFLVVNEDKMLVDGAHIFRKQKLIGYTSKEGKFSMPNMPLGDTVFFKFNEISAIHVVSENTRKMTQTITLHSSGIQIESRNEDSYVPPKTNYSPPIVVKSKEEQIYFDTDEMAEFPSGKSEMIKYVAKNLIYPENAIKNEIQGKCYLRFVVEKNGEISEIRVTKGIQNCPECDIEAKRIVRNFPNFIPAKINGEVVRSYFDLSLNFQLD